MQVTCPSCGARYAVDPTAIGPAGRTVQCVRCNHRWREKAIAPTAPIAPFAAAPPQLRPLPDLVVRPPSSNNSGLPGNANLPATRHWGRWLMPVLVLLLALSAVTFAFRHDIKRNLPTQWQAYFDLDAIRGLLRQ